MKFHSHRLGLAVFAMLAAAPALAQTPTPTPAPQLDAAPEKGGPGQNLSDKLNKSNGVIRPKDVDPAMDKPAPKTGDANVVPPPSAAPQAK